MCLFESSHSQAFLGRVDDKDAQSQQRSGQGVSRGERGTIPRSGASTGKQQHIPSDPLTTTTTTTTTGMYPRRCIPPPPTRFMDIIHRSDGGRPPPGYLSSGITRPQRARVISLSRPILLGMSSGASDLSGHSRGNLNQHSGKAKKRK